MITICVDSTTIAVASTPSFTMASTTTTGNLVSESFCFLSFNIFCCISAYYSCSNFTITMNWDYPGNDFVHVSPMSFPVCCAWCLSTSICTTFAFTNSSAICWIKTSTGGAGLASPGFYCGNNLNIDK